MVQRHEVYVQHAVSLAQQIGDDVFSGFAGASGEEDSLFGHLLFFDDDTDSMECLMFLNPARPFRRTFQYHDLR
jgi:hypothetical protein